MALMSPPIAVANADVVRYEFKTYRDSVNVQVVFYSDANGTVQIAGGTGLRDITAENEAEAFEGQFADPGPEQQFLSGMEKGSLLGAVDGRWYELLLGGGMQNVLLSAVANVNPGGAVTYRLIVDAPGSSELV